MVDSGHHAEEGSLAAQRYSPRPLTAGEIWTAEALERLRRRRYRPTAWRGFIAESLRRSTASRSKRPAMARQAAHWGVGGGGAWLALCVESHRHGDLELRPLAGLLWWAAVWQMLDWHLGMAEGGDGLPHRRLSPADAITLFRFWLVPVALGAAASPSGLPTVVVAGGLSDWLDGAVARSRGRTRLGRDLDSTADLAFIGAAALAARSSGRLPGLGAGALASRQGIGLVLALSAVFGRARRPAIRARPWGGALRFGGLACCAVGRERTGTALLVAGCLVPPRSTAPGFSVA